MDLGACRTLPATGVSVHRHCVASERLASAIVPSQKISFTEGFGFGHQGMGEGRFHWKIVTKKSVFSLFTVFADGFGPRDVDLDPRDGRGSDPWASRVKETFS